MNVTKGSHPIRASGSLQTLLFTGGGLAIALVAWGIVSFRSAGNQADDTPPVLFDSEFWTSVRSAAFLVNSGPLDHLVVHTPGSDQSPKVLASFERRGDTGARGQASPMVDKVAVVHPAIHVGARLTIVDVDGGARQISPALVDTNTTVAWTRDGSALVVTSSTQADTTGRLSASLLLIDATSGETRTIATFESVFRVAPVGFSLDGNRLFVIVSDQSGSSLWTVSEGEPALVASLSPGRTRDWALSPDGTMLAYIEVRSGASVPTVGRAVFTATGAPIQATDNTAPQEGVVWQPGNAMPGFGGPGGTLRLAVRDLSSTAYVVPEAWSPDGTRLIARVVHPSPTGKTSTVTWELFRSPDSATSANVDDSPARSIIFDGPGEVSFLGWVKSAPQSHETVKE